MLINGGSKNLIPMNLFKIDFEYLLNIKRLDQKLTQFMFHLISRKKISSYLPQSTSARTYIHTRKRSLQPSFVFVHDQ